MQIFKYFIKTHIKPNHSFTYGVLHVIATSGRVLFKNLVVAWRRDSVIIDEPPKKYVCQVNVDTC
jgi:hypothetical protein